MSIDVRPSRTLGEYIAELVARTARADADAGRRLRDVVGARSGRIQLDDEAVVVRFDHVELVVVPATRYHAVDGEGVTDRRTVLDILDGHLEVSEALITGRIATRGDTTAVTAMLHAIEILLDVSARSPALQALADDLRRDSADVAAPRWAPSSDADAARREEDALLARLDLL